ncbi:MAG: response regulator [Candidatus Sericytochromatia bacterium]
MNAPVNAAGNEPFHLLIVDDVAQNIQIVASMLKFDQYRLSFALSGQVALQLIEQQRFDLILLDIQMPEMDGFAVCERLKQDERTRDIPVIFLTANASTDHTVHGFQLGAVDYITKPVEPMELRARVRTHLELKLARDQILEQNERLRHLNHEKSELLRIVSHDLRTPLTVLSSGLEFLHNTLTDSDSRISRRLNNMRIATERMEAIINHFLNRDAIQLGRRTIHAEPFLVPQVVAKVIRHHQEWALSKQLQLLTETDTALEMRSDRAALEQILDNLISNAIKYSPSQRKIWIRARAENDTVVLIEVEDQGPGFTPEDHQHLFARSGRLSAEPTSGEESLGLGLSIVKRMIDLLQGQIHCESQAGAGARFVLTLPRYLEAGSQVAGA